MGKLGRFFHTVRHLKTIQVLGLLRQHLPAPRPDTRPAPPLRPPSGPWAVPARRRPSLLGPAEICLLNETHTLDGRGIWNDTRRDKLWLYNLHYFDDLNAQDAASRSAWQRGLIGRWLDENPPGFGTGWEPFPTSLRIVNWIKWSLAGQAAAERRLSEAAIQSLAVQARAVRSRMEFHLLGNHLLANIKALLFAGAFFQGEEANAWLAYGLRLLRTQLGEQILPDGGHFELSPMYHSLALEDLLDLHNLARAYGSDLPALAAGCGDELLETIGRMRRWLMTMIHPDGELAFFNDTALGVAPAPAELEQYAARLDVPGVARPADGLTHLEASGYIRWQSPDAVALLDVARIGPDYLPGHAHADTLSYELSLFGQRFAVNAGTSCYGVSDERLRQRGTAAHNTVVVDGEDSSEVWSSFRVARRAYPRDLHIERLGNTLEYRVSGSHDGYRRLPGRVTHRRTWRLTPKAIDVTDELQGRFRSAIARLHLHPSIGLNENASLRGLATSPAIGAKSLSLSSGGHGVEFTASGGRVAIETATYHPEFGRMIPIRSVVLRAEGSEFSHRLGW